MDNRITSSPATPADDLTQDGIKERARIAALEARLAASTGREQGKQMVIAQLEARCREQSEDLALAMTPQS